MKFVLCSITYNKFNLSSYIFDWDIYVYTVSISLPLDLCCMILWVDLNGTLHYLQLLYFLAGN